MKSAGLSLMDIKRFLKYYEEGNKTLDLRIDMLKNQKIVLEKRN